MSTIYRKIIKIVVIFSVSLFTVTYLLNSILFVEIAKRKIQNETVNETLLLSNLTDLISQRLNKAKIILSENDTISQEEKSDELNKNEQSSNVGYCFLIDLEGRTINERFKDINFINYSFYKKAINGKSGITKINTPENLEKEQIVFYTPYIKDSKTEGVLLYCYTEDYITTVINMLSQSSKKISVLCDEEGNYITEQKENESVSILDFAKDKMSDSHFKLFKSKFNEESNFIYKYGNSREINFITCSTISDYKIKFITINTSKNIKALTRNYFLIETFISIILVLFLAIQLIIIIVKNKKAQFTNPNTDENLQLTIDALGQMFLKVYLVDIEKNNFIQITSNDPYSINIDRLGTYDKLLKSITSFAKEKSDSENLFAQLERKSIEETFNEDVSYLRYELETNLSGCEWLHIMFICVKRKKNKPEKILITLQDVTAMKKEEVLYHEFIKETVAAAEKANRTRNIFLSNISHDMLTPLNAITGMTELSLLQLKNNEPNNNSEEINKLINTNEKLSGYIDTIEQSSKLLAEHLNRLLNLSSIESGNFVLKKENVNMEQFTSSIIARFIPQMIDKNIKIYSKIENLNDKEYIFDSQHLALALSNILENSVKYTQVGGTIFFRINEKFTGVESKSELEFSIEDTGIGMSNDIINHIYDPFYRKDNTRSGKIPGTGIGLTIAQNIISMMEGTILVDSEIAHGTKFTVRIPVNIQSNKNTEVDIIKNEKILVCDYDPFTQDFLKNLCDSTNVEIKNLTDKNDLNTINENNNYTIVILDKLTVSGFDVEKIKSLFSSAKIFMTTYEDITKEDTFLYNFAKFIKKPLFNASVLKKLKPQENKVKTVKKENEEVKRIDYSKLRVLITEDNAFNAEVASALLESLKIQTELAENGQIAIDKLLSKPAGFYDLVLMDIKMPNLDGYTTTRIIRGEEREDLHSIPIIAYTSCEKQEEKLLCLSSGMNDIIEKPIDMRKLIEILNKNL